MRVLVLDKNKNSLMPCHPARARKLLSKGKASVFRHMPYTIILNEREGGDMQPIEVKTDPGSKTTGICLVGLFKRGAEVLWAMELNHRGQAIRDDLLSRKSYRRGRRQRHTRYRAARFNNRRRKEGWLPPSLQHRVETTATWVERLIRFSPATAISQELVKFDMQLMQNANIDGVEYQQGALAGYELREYLLEKWGRKCVYCNKSNVPLQVEHIISKKRGGSNRPSNLTISCGCCNQDKDTLPVEEFLKNKPELLKKIKAHTKAPLKDAAAVNSTRWSLFNRLKETQLPVATGSGGLTKYNRIRLNIEKSHWADAACVGKVDSMHIPNWIRSLTVTAVGHGTRRNQSCDKYGFPRGSARAVTEYSGFKTGAYVELNQPKGKYAGVWRGNLASIRATGTFDIRVMIDGKPAKISANVKNFTLLQKPDGYRYV